MMYLVRLLFLCVAVEAQVWPQCHLIEQEWSDPVMFPQAGVKFECNAHCQTVYFGLQRNGPDGTDAHCYCGDTTDGVQELPCIYICGPEIEEYQYYCGDEGKMTVFNVCPSECPHNCNPFGVCYDCPENCLFNVCEYDGQCHSCNDGYHGSTCEDSCAITCVKCDQFEALTCTQCIPGWYGATGCNSRCGNCLNGTCAIDNGYCTPCIDGFHGQLCQQPCPDNCTGNTCDQYSGHCTSCEPGWYGPTCSLECPNNCVDNVCDLVDATCVNGCLVGFWGHRCATNCSKNCLKGTCSQYEGFCFNGCNDGYYGNFCDMLCPDDCHGSICNQSNGECLSCPPGTYGPDCTPCPDNCVDAICDVASGVCSSCDATFYGDQCTESCPGNCKDGICDRNNGFCEICENGWFGDKCSESCPKNCKDRICDIHSGICDGCNSFYSGELCKSGIGVGAVAGICVAGVVILAAIITIAVFFLCKRRRKPSSKQPTKAATTGKTRSYVRQSGTGLDNEGFEGIYENDIKPSPQTVPKPPPVQVPKPVPKSAGAEPDVVDRLTPVEDFPGYVESRKQAEKDPFGKEYKSLPQDTLYEWEEATAEGAKDKNRFRDIYPYNYNRVLLEQIGSDPSTTYVNASRIQGYHPVDKFIAAMGPLEHTVPDFWRMLWQDKIEKVVMVTNLTERGQNKCFPYWPKTGRVKYKTITVSLLKEDEWPNYTLRKFMLVKDGAKRLVDQYHFTVWPDHGVPSDATALLNFRRKALNLATSNVPVAVHCSAGVGRTGTLIGLDYLIKQAEAEGQVNVLDAVRVLRYQRKHIVQTKAQYVFLHEALSEYLRVGNTTIATASFLPRYMEMVRGSKGNNGCWEHEYAILSDLAAELTQDDKEYPLSEENIDKNRDVTVLPKMGYRVILMVPVPERNDYINAVRVNSFQLRDAYIVTEFPQQNTAVDFWRMVKEYETNTMVLLKNADIQSESVFIPAKNRPMDILDDVARVHKSLTMDTFRTTDIRLTGRTAGDVSGEDSQTENEYMNLGQTLDDTAVKQQDIRMYEISVPSSQPVLDHKTVMDVFLNIQRWTQVRPRRPIIVVCPDGKTYAGQFVACANLFEMINSEQEVDVFQVAKYIRDSRPQFIGNLDQYKGLYDAVKLYLSAFDTYSNFQ